MKVMRCDDDIKPIAPILRRMEVQDIVTYPIDRYMVVYMTVNRMHSQYKEEGRRFKVAPDGARVIVQRIS
jgi:hypothetical protein